MKAKFINEIQKFERGIDPKDAMNVGDVKLREVLKNIDTVKIEIKEALTNGTDMNFKDASYKIKAIQDSFMYIIERYLTNQFGIMFGEDSKYSAYSSIGYYKGAKIIISGSNSGMSYFVSVYYNGKEHPLTSSQSLHTMNKKLNILFKELGI